MQPDNTSLGIPLAESMTHQHIAAVINSFLGYQPRTGVLRVLDVGCGDGHLLSHIQSALPVLRPTLSFELHGMDVSDAGQQVAGYFKRTMSLLKARHPEIDWLDRLRLVTAVDRWPYEDGYFDFITSNQVMEHVVDHHFVFSEIRRCLRQGGVSVNLFPVREVLWEGHAYMPLVHLVRDVSRRERLMLFFAKMGFTKHYHREMERRGWRSIDEFAHTFARVL